MKHRRPTAPPGDPTPRGRDLERTSRTPARSSGDPAPWGLLFALFCALLCVPGAASAHPVVRAPSPPSFPHDKHAQIACAQCHPQASQALRPGEISPVLAAPCQSCHGDTQRPAPRGVEAPWALHFSHRAHLGRGLDCTDCHAGGRAAQERDCLSCHSDSPPAGKPKAPSACAVCHPSGPDGFLRTDWPRGPLLPRAPGQDHRSPHWVSGGHAHAAKASPADCAACHRPADCTGCHVGHDRPREIHPPDYLLTHPVEARRDLHSCASCHRQQNFCVGCHTQSGVSFGTHALAFGAATPGRARFHPPGFAGASGGAPGPEHHRFSARRQLATCVSCHQERDCVGCHTASAPPALRASPHPKGHGRALCRRALEANPRGCLKCHSDLPSLRRLCDL